MGFISTTPVTELEAINIMLAAIGESAVSSLENATTVEVTQAKSLLSNVNREVQQKGWHFNTEWDVTISRNASNQLPLGSNILFSFILFGGYYALQKEIKSLQLKHIKYSKF